MASFPESSKLKLYVPSGMIWEMSETPVLLNAPVMSELNAVLLKV